MPEGGEASHPAAPCTQNSSPPVSILVAVWWLCHRGAVSAEEPSCLGTTAASSSGSWMSVTPASSTAIEFHLSWSSIPQLLQRSTEPQSPEIEIVISQWIHELAMILETSLSTLLINFYICAQCICNLMIDMLFLFEVSSVKSKQQLLMQWRITQHRQSKPTIYKIQQ